MEFRLSSPLNRLRATPSPGSTQGSRQPSTPPWNSGFQALCTMEFWLSSPVDRLRATPSPGFQTAQGSTMKVPNSPGFHHGIPAFKPCKQTARHSQPRQHPRFQTAQGSSMEFRLSSPVNRLRATPSPGRTQGSRQPRVPPWNSGFLAL